MFTGLVEEQGKIAELRSSANGVELKIQCKKILDDIKNGASICTNGVCLTVTDYGTDYIKVQASNETLRVSNFKFLYLLTNFQHKLLYCL